MNRTPITDSGSLTTNRKKLVRILEELNSDSEDDWSYKLKDCGNGLYGINVYDENGQLVKENATLW
jgi:hypothetical protein